MTRWHWLLLALAAVAAAFAAGRITAREPDVKAEEKATETAKVQTVEVAMARDEWVTQREEERERVVVRTVYRERLPDGTQREFEHTTEGDTAKVVEAAAGSSEQLAAKVQTVEVVREVERRVEVSTPLPDWRASALVGYSGELVYGAAVERRILGPISIGAWGLSNTTFGASAAIEFF